MPTIMFPISGHDNQPVSHEFITQDGNARHLALFLPGFAYSCDMPIFYYAETLLLSAGADLLRMEYAYHRDPGFRDLSPKAKIARLLADASPAIRAALAQREYSAVSVVAKSLGTITLAHLIDRGDLPETTTAIWTTPILTHVTVLATIRSHPGPQVVVIGESDPEYSAELIGALSSNPGLRTLTIPQADHSLDVQRDTIASIAALSATISAIASVMEPGPSAEVG